MELTLNCTNAVVTRQLSLLNLSLCKSVVYIQLVFTTQSHRKKHNNKRVLVYVTSSPLCDPDIQEAH